MSDLKHRKPASHITKPPSGGAHVDDASSKARQGMYI